MIVIINNFKKQYPILICVILSVAFLAFIKLTKFINFSDQPYYTTALVREIAIALFTVAMIMMLKEKSILSKKQQNFIKGMGIAAFPLLLEMLLIASGFLNPEGTLLPLSNIIVFILFVLSVGIAEELFCRGIVTNIIAQKYAANERGVYFTVFLSGIIFGAMHLPNTLSGVNLSGALIQSICAMSSGCLYSAIYLRTRNIWLLCFLHAVGDFAAGMSSGLYGVGTINSIISSYSPINLISALIYLIPVFYLLRKSKISEMV